MIIIDTAEADFTSFNPHVLLLRFQKLAPALPTMQLSHLLISLEGNLSDCMPQKALYFFFSVAVV